MHCDLTDRESRRRPPTSADVSCDLISINTDLFMHQYLTEPGVWSACNYQAVQRSSASSKHTYIHIHMCVIAINSVASQVHNKWPWESFAWLRSIVYDVKASALPDNGLIKRKSFLATSQYIRRILSKTWLSYMSAKQLMDAVLCDFKIKPAGYKHCEIDSAKMSSHSS